MAMNTIKVMTILQLTKTQNILCINLCLNCSPIKPFFIGNPFVSICKLKYFREMHEGPACYWWKLGPWFSNIKKANQSTELNSIIPQHSEYILSACSPNLSSTSLECKRQLTLIACSLPVLFPLHLFGPAATCVSDPFSTRWAAEWRLVSELAVSTDSSWNQEENISWEDIKFRQKERFKLLEVQEKHRPWYSGEEWSRLLLKCS